MLLSLTFSCRLACNVKLPPGSFSCRAAIVHDMLRINARHALKDLFKRKEPNAELMKNNVVDVKQPQTVSNILRLLLQDR